jgi:hypothetical protein
MISIDEKKEISHNKDMLPTYLNLLTYSPQASRSHLSKKVLKKQQRLHSSIGKKYKFCRFKLVASLIPTLNARKSNNGRAQ